MNYSQLQRNIVLNHSSSSIQAFPVALSDTTGLNTLELSDLLSGAALHQVSTEGTPAGAHKQACLTYRLDDFVSVFGIPQPNHIKLDVDGHEVSVLDGAVKTLSSCDLKSLLIEIDDGSGNREAVFERLTRCGLILQGDRHTHCEGCSRYGNFLFLRETVRSS